MAGNWICTTFPGLFRRKDISEQNWNCTRELELWQEGHVQQITMLAEEHEDSLLQHCLSVAWKNIACPAVYARISIHTGRKWCSYLSVFIMLLNMCFFQDPCQIHFLFLHFFSFLRDMASNIDHNEIICSICVNYLIDPVTIGDFTTNIVLETRVFLARQARPYHLLSSIEKMCEMHMKTKNFCEVRKDLLCLLCCKSKEHVAHRHCSIDWTAEEYRVSNGWETSLNLEDLIFERFERLSGSKSNFYSSMHHIEQILTDIMCQTLGSAIAKKIVSIL